MITFACPQCRRAFTVPDARAGKTARCPSCQNSVQIPASPQASTPQAAPQQAAHATLLPASAPVADLTPAVPSVSVKRRQWLICEILTAVIAGIHALAWSSASNALTQAAISAAAAAWIITVYVLTRCEEKRGAQG